MIQAMIRREKGVFLLDSTLCMNFISAPKNMRLGFKAAR